MSLVNYRKKRSFDITAEPKGKAVSKKKKKDLIFVVQKHDASHLHYDLRLEMEGTLKSWAVPKGPSLEPSVKRLAIHVEDHPIEYANFEGTIPKGMYGAGEVEIWDKGTYNLVDPNQEPIEEYDKGKISFIFHGNKLKGEFALVKTRQDNQWLLIKKTDEYASAALEDPPKSNLKEKPSKMPRHISPMLAMVSDKAFNDPDWIFEIKWDGYRAIAEISKKHCELYSRNFNSFNHKFPLIIEELSTFKKDMIVDGEIVVLDDQGRSNFQLIQNYPSEGVLGYYLFDLLYYDGKDLRLLPLIERKEILKKILSANSFQYIHYSEHQEKEGIPFFKEAKKLDLEGIMAKNKFSKYISKRSSDWLKIKVKNEVDAVIGGFTEPKGSRSFIGAILVGLHEGKNLIFKGSVGGGFNEKGLKNIFSMLKPLQIDYCPFKNPPKINPKPTWVKPTFKCKIVFQEWTQEGIMRQPIFKELIENQNGRKMVKKTSHKADVDIDSNHISTGTSKGTNLQKIYWPKEKYTKEDLIDYYQTISPVMLPYLKDRPEVLHRFPNGIEGEDFWQKAAPDFLPNWIKKESVVHTEKTIDYIIINNMRSLLYVANLGAIEINPFASKIGTIDEPDYAILDLDPESTSFKNVVKTALEIHDLLEEIKIPNFCKTSGKRGLHILIPLKKGYTFDQAEQFAELVATIVHQRLPAITSLVRKPQQRQKKVYIDFLQNGRTKTITAPYSVRPTPLATVSTPLLWEELNDKLDPTSFTIKTVPERVDKMGDVLQPFLKQKGNLLQASKRLGPALSRSSSP